jgi:membrane-bound inhibitor of C-type lysozyme
MNMNLWSGAVLALSLTALGGARADESLPAAKVPAPVLAAVTTRYANARQVAWSKEREAGAIQYEVKLEQATQHLEVTLDGAGKVLAEEIEIELKAAPAAVQKAFAASKYGAWTLHKVEQITDGQEATKLTFEIAADQKAERVEVVFDANGKQLSVELHHKKQ